MDSKMAPKTVGGTPLFGSKTYEFLGREAKLRKNPRVGSTLLQKNPGWEAHYFSLFLKNQRFFFYENHIKINLSPEPPFGCFLVALCLSFGAKWLDFASLLLPFGSFWLPLPLFGSPWVTLSLHFRPLWPPFGGIFPPFWLPLAPKLLFLQFLLRFSMFLREFSKKSTKTLPLDSPWCCDSDFGRIYINFCINCCCFCVFFQNDIKTDQKTKKNELGILFLHTQPAKPLTKKSQHRHWKITIACTFAFPRPGAGILP